MDIKKIESTNNDFILFLNKEELNLIERVLLERIVRSVHGDNYNTKFHEYTNTEFNIIQTLRDEIWDVLYC